MSFEADAPFDSHENGLVNLRDGAVGAEGGGFLFMAHSTDGIFAGNPWGRGFCFDAWSVEVGGNGEGSRLSFGTASLTSTTSFSLLPIRLTSSSEVVDRR